jgi:poly-gamma-glutamate capsule biosynthesis protein CapA/YwtB (metallophosphatase superfamily)
LLLRETPSGYIVPIEPFSDKRKGVVMKRRFSIPTVLLVVIIAATAAFSQANEPDEVFTMALTGDSIITRKLSVYEEPQFLEMIDLIREADVAFTNVEMLFHNYESYPMNESGGTYMRAEPAMVKELVWAGFDLGSLANNHTGDYGVAAMQMTRDYVDQAGIVAAGTGDSLMEAREAKFLETSEARVALISVASTFPDHARASRSRGDMPARPGLNPLRYSTTYVITRERLETLRDTLKELGMRVPDEGDELRIFRNRFVVGTKPEVRTEVNQQDLDEIASVVRNATGLADYTIVTFHGHESGASRFAPADFLVEFARAMIDSGADVVVGHGPHVLRAVEIYKGKPIFYSVGDFMFQNETLLRLPQENYARYGLGLDAHVSDFNAARYNNDTSGFPATPEIWEAVIAVPKFKSGELHAVELHPITLGYGKPRTVRGRPMFAGPELAKKIIGDLQRLSKPYGTEIALKDGIGVVELDSRTTN